MLKGVLEGIEESEAKRERRESEAKKERREREAKREKGENQEYAFAVSSK
jgi:hypothetical protein